MADAQAHKALVELDRLGRFDDVVEQSKPTRRYWLAILGKERGTGYGKKYAQWLDDCLAAHYAGEPFPPPPEPRQVAEGGEARDRQPVYRTPGRVLVGQSMRHVNTDPEHDYRGQPRRLGKTVLAELADAAARGARAGGSWAEPTLFVVNDGPE